MTRLAAVPVTGPVGETPLIGLVWMYRTSTGESRLYFGAAFLAPARVERTNERTNERKSDAVRVGFSVGRVVLLQVSIGTLAGRQAVDLHERDGGMSPIRRMNEAGLGKL